MTARAREWGARVQLRAFARDQPRRESARAGGTPRNAAARCTARADRREPLPQHVQVQTVRRVASHTAEMGQQGDRVRHVGAHGVVGQIALQP